jgi:hypothetical protein
MLAERGATKLIDLRKLRELWRRKCGGGTL